MCQKVDSKDFNLGELKMTISSSLAGQNNETKDLFQQIAIPNHTNNPSESFRVIIGKGSCFVIKTFNLSLIVKLLITAQFQQIPISFNETGKKCAKNKQFWRFYLLSTQEVIATLCRHHTALVEAQEKSLLKVFYNLRQAQIDWQLVNQNLTPVLYTLQMWMTFSITGHTL